MPCEWAMDSRRNRCEWKFCWYEMSIGVAVMLKSEILKGGEGAAGGDVAADDGWSCGGGDGAMRVRMRR